jgi:hypothetical protein
MHGREGSPQKMNLRCGGGGSAKNRRKRGRRKRVSREGGVGFKVRQKYQGSSIATSKLLGKCRNPTVIGDRQVLVIYSERRFFNEGEAGEAMFLVVPKPAERLSGEVRTMVEGCEANGQAGPERWRFRVEIALF